ncbi:hypothetical protein K8O92_23950 [Nocardia asteroides]|nr:hypothetical protein K8O92_23950 [Nocardia asteroides]
MPQQPATDAGHRDVGGSTPVPAVAAIDDATRFSLPGGIVASNENPNGLPALRVRHIDGDIATFTDIAGIGPNGAFLVRPDHFVAWRSPALPTSPENAIRQLLVVVRCRVAGGGCTSGHPDMTTK